MPTIPRAPSDQHAPAALPQYDEGKVPEGFRPYVTALYRAVTAILRIFKDGISLGSGRHGEQGGLLDTQWLVVTLPSRFTDHAFPHGLGRKPKGYTIWKQEHNFSDGPAPQLAASATQAWTSDLIWLNTDTNGGVTFLILLA